MLLRFASLRPSKTASLASFDELREPFGVRVARILQDERLKRRLSMTLVAERTGLSQQMVSYVERGMRLPTLDTLLRLCEALGIELEDVIRQARHGTAKTARR